MPELLIGCGATRDKRLFLEGSRKWQDLTTLDINPDHKPDVLHDLEILPVPLPDNHFDEIHGYEILEHLGKQGGWRFFFAQFSDFWRLLKPGGHFFATVPSLSSPWCWGDPGHCRVISHESLIFLNQTQYTAQIGKTAMSDYRFVYKADFDIIHSEVKGDQFAFVLKAIKPSRIKGGRK